MEKQTVLITGANGEIGHALIPLINQTGQYDVIALDLYDLDPDLKAQVKQFIQADILNKEVLLGIFNENAITAVFHLAAMLSTSGEKNPELAHSVNVNGTINLLELARNKGQQTTNPVRFIFPSSIAAYGIPTLEAKNQQPKVLEEEFPHPITMYGINKLYCEELGRYFSQNYKLLEGNQTSYLDFRCVRFPGIISAITVPSGGTSDYAPEMLHSAAQGEGYESFVRPDSIIPFMTMPDAVKALMQLFSAPKEKLTQMVYNVSGFSATAEQIAQMVSGVFPDSAISYNPDINRQKIVDSWPQDIDDTKAQKDWGWKADYDFEKAFKDYLIPAIQEKYK